MLSLLCSLLASAVGTLVPLFYSYKTIKKPTHKSSVYWLKYWCIYGVGYTIDVLLNTFCLTWFIPFYDVMKLGFVVWCVNPYTAGAQFTFDKVLAPFIRKHERRMEKSVQMLVSKITDYGPYLLTEAGRSLMLNYASMSAAVGNDMIVDTVTEISIRQEDITEKSTLLSTETDVLIVRDVKLEPMDDSYDQIEIIGHSRNSVLDVSQDLSIYSSGDEDMVTPGKETAARRGVRANKTNDGAVIDRIKDEPNEEIAPRRSSRLRSRAQGVAAIRRWSRSTQRAVQPIKSDASV